MDREISENDIEITNETKTSSIYKQIEKQFEPLQIKPNQLICDSFAGVILWPCSFIPSFRKAFTLGQRLETFKKAEKKVNEELDIIKLLKHVKNIEDRIHKLHGSTFDEFCLKY